MRPQMHQNLHKNSVFPVQLYTGITVQWDPEATQGDPGVTQVWPRCDLGWPRGDPGATQGWPKDSVFWASNWGNPGVMWGQPGVSPSWVYPQVAPGSPLGCLQVALGRFRVTLEPNNKVVLCNKLFLAWLFFCEMDYSSVICNNTLVYIRGYGRSAGVKKAGLGQQGLGGASRGTTNSKSRFSLKTNKKNT